MRWIIRSSLRFRFLVIAAAAVLMIVGAGQLENARTDAFPEFAPPRVEVQTVTLGLSAEETEEFVTGPLNAGAFGPNALDATFGPRVVFQAAPPAPNTSPADGFQFFGHVAIDGPSGVMTVSLRDLDGRVLFTQALQPA